MEPENSSYIYESLKIMQKNKKCDAQFNRI